MPATNSADDYSKGTFLHLPGTELESYRHRFAAHTLAGLLFNQSHEYKDMADEIDEASASGEERRRVALENSLAIAAVVVELMGLASAAVAQADAKLEKTPEASILTGALGQAFPFSKWGDPMKAPYWRRTAVNEIEREETRLRWNDSLSWAQELNLAVRTHMGFDAPSELPERG